MRRFFFLRILTVISLYFALINFNYSQESILKTGDEWFFYDKTESPPEGWYENDIISKDWSKGVTPVGYGDSTVKTEISYGNDPENKTITNYFKKTFNLDDPFKFILYKLNIIKDDGIVVYLNGKEITRVDMPDGEIDHNSLARGLIVMGKMEEYVHTIVLSPEDFISGKNTISASVHKAKVTTEDCIFSLELISDNDPQLLPELLKKSSLKNMQINSRVNELISRLEIEKKDLKIELIEQTKSSIKVYLFVIGFLLIATLSILALFWYNTRNKERKTIQHIQDLKDKNNDNDIELINTSIKYYNNKHYLKEFKKEI